MALLAELLNAPYLVQGVCIVLLVLFISSFWDDLADEIPYGKVPLMGKNWWDLSNKKAKLRFTESARSLIAEGFAKVRGDAHAIHPDQKMLMRNRAQMSSRSWP